jgi:hypothetical protein
LVALVQVREPLTASSYKSQSSTCTERARGRGSRITHPQGCQKYTRSS